MRQSPLQRVVGIVFGSLCCASYAVRPDLAVLAPSALAWALTGRSLAAWVRRLAGIALLLGLVATPFGIALFMLASVGAALLEPARATGARLTSPWSRWRPAPGLSADPR